MRTNTLLSLLIVAALAACSQKTETTAPPVVVAVPVPVAAPAPAPAPAPIAPVSAADLAIGEKVYTATCAACHAAAVMGAPKLADAAAWSPRIAKGVNVLYKSSFDGLKLMPARGGNPALKDEELRAAVDYMVSKAM
jgi:cytochrome c5